MTDHQIKKLNDYEHVRLRAEILFGSREVETRRIPIFDGSPLALCEITWVPAIFTCFREILDNALDELVAHKHGDKLTVDFDPEKFVFTIEDNGRGIPLHHDERLGGVVASVALSESRTGRNFEERGAQAGMNGVGASGVNFTSEFFELQVWQGSQHFAQTWHEGPQHLTDGPVIKTIRGKRHGTRVRFTPSRIVYPNIVLPDKIVRSHLWMVAALNPSIKVVYNGMPLRPSDNDFAKSILSGFKPFTLAIDCWDDGGFTSTFWVVPNFTEDEEVSYGLVNLIPSWSGMDHVDVFKTEFYGGVIAALESRAKREGITLHRNDASCGVLIFNVTAVANATFDSQSKSRLTKGGVNQKIKQSFDLEALKRLLKQHPEWADEIIKRAKERQLLKDVKEVEREQKKNKRVKVVGLRPATGLDREKCILFLTEGESAISELLAVRDPKLHGGLGLRGKILNVFEATPLEVLENKVLSGIIAAIGLRIGHRAERRLLKYGAVYLASDEDEDGKNITALLVNFFFRFWPELFDAAKKPYFYRFETPYIIARKGKGKEQKVKYFYGHNYDEFHRNIGAFKSWEITRAKGLGALRKEDWKNAVTKPLLFPIVDDGDLGATLDLIFSKNRSSADNRKAWLTNDD